MVFIHISVIAVLGLLSLGETAPLSSCDSLIQPLEIRGPEQLLGKWMRVAVSSDHEEAELLQAFQDSYWMRLTADNESDVISVMGALKGFGLCFTLTTRLTLVNNTLQQYFFVPGNVTLLKTECSDCLLLQTQNYIMGKTYDNLILMSKRQTVTAAEMEELQKQADCLNLIRPFSLSFDRGQCPEPESPGADVIDMTPLFSGDTDVRPNIIEKILNATGGLDNFLKRVTDATQRLQRNDQK
ncbi:uncharacterized protein LOC117815548 [Xyrichtys novacula]|uniref:Uncharacterized protein LOC117815548 n=1 Tax=Xyrichtys novacula TaxID=13765 RepID=A0AAV1ETT5_XYRNO|nr:uncharacterized protein LOC117815548 [Xyrichtys novacula]